MMHGQKNIKLSNSHNLATVKTANIDTVLLSYCMLMLTFRIDS